MNLYMFSGSGFAWRVELAMAIKNVDYTQVAVEPSDAGLKGPDFLALNPRGKVPVFTDRDFTLPESLAIMAYLDSKHPEPPLFGTTPEETGLIWKTCLDFDLYVVNDWVFRFIARAFTGQVSTNAEDVRAVIQGCHDDLARFDEAVEETGWLCGSRISAADIAVFPMIEGLLRSAAKDDVHAVDTSLLEFATRYPALEHWRSDIQALPNYAQSYPAYWRKMDEAA